MRANILLGNHGLTIYSSKQRGIRLFLFSDLIADICKSKRKTNCCDNNIRKLWSESGILDLNVPSEGC